MHPIDVTPPGLEALAVQCLDHAEAVASTGGGFELPVGQPTAAAVSTMDGTVTSVGVAMAAHLTGVAGMLRASASAYTQNEVISVEEIRAVHPGATS